MFNPRTMAAKAALSLLVLAPLVPVGVGVAAASTRTAHTTTAATASRSTARDIICARHRAILAQTHQRLEAYGANTTSDRGLLEAARRGGNPGRTKFLTHIVSQRHTHEMNHLANLDARRARYRKLDLANGC